MNILFLGDVVGKVGRKALLSELKKIKSTYSKSLFIRKIPWCWCNYFGKSLSQ